MKISELKLYWSNIFIEMWKKAYFRRLLYSWYLDSKRGSFNILSISEFVKSGFN